MAILKRYRVQWLNFPGAPGISTHYLNNTVTDYSPIRAFYLAIQAQFPNSLTFNFPSTVDQFDPVDGELTGSVSTTPGAVVSGTGGAAAFSGTSGAVARWVTGAVMDGHRLVGRTYLVPLYQSAYNSSGGIASATQTAIQNAAQTMITALGGELMAWHRPVAFQPAKPDGTPAVPARDGGYASITGCVVPGTAAVLRSRRV